MRNLRIVALLAATLLLSTTTHGQSGTQTDRQRVERTIQMYFDAWAVGDTASVRPLRIAMGCIEPVPAR